MFSPLQDALKKLREAKQAEQSQPKRVAVAAPSTPQPAASQHPRAADDELDELDDLDIDLGDADLFDDLAAGDQHLGAAQHDKPRHAPPTGRADTHRPGPQSSALSKFSFRPQPDRPTAGTEPRQNAPAPAGQRQQDGASSQANVFAPPRTADRAAGIGNRPAGQSRTITTTVVGSRTPRRAAAAPEKQRLPGPAGILGEAASTGVAAAQKPASPFKTPLLRAVEGEQTGSVDFEGGTWAAMLDHLKMPAYKPSTAKDVVRAVDAAEWPIRRVLDVARTQRVRIMLVQLREMGNSDTDVCAVVVDPTGEMEASIHRPVVKRFVHFLEVGASIILRDVVVMKVPDSRPFLVITAASVEQIFTSKGAGTREDPIILSATQALGGAAAARDRSETPTPAPARHATSGPAPAMGRAPHTPSPEPQGDSDADDFDGGMLAGDEGVDALLDLPTPSP